MQNLSKRFFAAYQRFNRGIGKVRQESYQQFTRCIPSNWDEFPTQSPVCGGDDGLPGELDRITFYKWRAKYGGMDVSMMSRMKELEEENRRLKKMYLEEKLKAEIVSEALEKKW